MDIKRFTEEKGYDHNILVYPNITYQRNLERDSFIVVISNVIRVLNQSFPNTKYTVLTPYETESLEFENVEQRKLELPTYPNAMRTHFEVGAVQSAVGDISQYNYIYSHLPEHTYQLRQLYPDTTIVGYCHWYEIDENTAYPKRLFMNNIIGTLQMDECGVNSEWLKSLVLRRASDHFNETIVDRLDQIIQSHPLGVDSIDLSDGYDQKTVIFNHRPNKYTGWRWFVRRMDELWEKRKDFTVYTTLTSVDRPWNEKVDLDGRMEYLNFLKSVSFGVGCFEDYSAWSISTTDGLSRGTPYLLPSGLCYPEMVGSDYPLLYNDRDDFVRQFERLLDEPSYRQTARGYIEEIIDDFLWENRVMGWMNWNKLQTDGDQ